MRIVEIANILKDHPNLKRKFEGLLPELIRRLIRETSSTVTYNRFPSGDAIATPGLDGIVKNNTECEFLPIGESFWEIGTSSLEKINKDYSKRTETLSEDIRKNTTFILVLPKYWHFDQTITLVEWQNERRENWKDVIIYDAEILNSWMESHPDVALWFLKELEITQNVLNCTLVEPAYDDLISCTEPKLNLQIFCEDREDAKINFINGICSEKIVYVKSESRFESFGFILSSILDEKSQNLKDICIVVNDKQSYDFLNKTLNEKILILNFENVDDLKLRNNKLIIPCYKSNFSGNGIELKIRGQRTMSKLLTDIGLDIHQSTDINYKSNGNLLIIRRLLAKDVIDKQPKWVNEQDIFCVTPLMLLQKFNISNIAHIRIAEYITGLNKDLFLQKISMFADVEDCPFRIIGDTYQLYNLEECWFALKKFMQGILFDKLCKIVKFIYSDKQTDNDTGLISDGISGTDLESILKILAFYAIDSEHSQMLVDSEVSLLLHLDNSNPYLIAKTLYILAECSPKCVCDFLEKQIGQKTEFLFNLLESNNYCYLLSPINYLLCLDKYKYRAIDLLFKLSTYDIKYFYANNPKTDLKEALIPYFSKNALSIKEKLEVLKIKMEQHTNIVELYLKIITSTNCCIPINFNVRKAECADNPTRAEIYAFREELDYIVLKKALEENNIQQIQEFINNYSVFHPEIFNNIDTYFEDNKDNLDDETLYQIYKLTIQKLSRIHKFQNKENWVNKKLYIEPFNAIIEHSKPKGTFLQYKYMFERYSDYIDIEDTDEELSFDALEERKNALRVEAINAILTQIGKNKTIVEYIDNVNDDGVWGSFLVRMFNDEDAINLIFDSCIKVDKYHLLAGVMNQAENKDIMIKVFREKQSVILKNKIIPILYQEEYEVLCDNDEEKEMFYSKKSVGIHKTCNENTYQKFLKYNPVGLLDYFYQKVFDDNLYYKAIELLNILKLKPDLIQQRHYLWELRELFKEMESYRYSEELALLELDLIEFFERLYPDAVVEYWFRNPNKFIEYFKTISADISKYSFIYNLEFELILKKKHYDDENGFVYFCDTLMKENNRFLLGVLGAIMGKSCVGKDGIFPHESVRFILEQNNEYINKHFRSGYINAIGARFVGSGKSEFDKAKKLEEDAKVLTIKYPITSEMLIKLSDFHKQTGNEDRKYDLLGL